MTGCILIVANETVAGDVLHDALPADAEAAAGLRVLVVSPALNSRLRHWVSDEDAARRAAESRPTSSLERLQAAGIPADGWVGDANPLQAIDDALHAFAANEIVNATHPRGRSHRLERDLVDR